MSCLLSLLQLMTDLHFQQLMGTCQSHEELKVGQLHGFSRTKMVTSCESPEASLVTPTRSSC